MRQARKSIFLTVYLVALSSLLVAAVGQQACGKEIPLLVLTIVLLGVAITLVTKANQGLRKIAQTA